jgi:hypothetical protein
MMAWMIKIKAHWVSAMVMYSFDQRVSVMRDIYIAHKQIAHHYV